MWLGSTSEVIVFPVNVQWPLGLIRGALILGAEWKNNDFMTDVRTAREDMKKDGIPVSGTVGGCRWAGKELMKRAKRLRDAVYTAVKEDLETKEPKNEEEKEDKPATEYKKEEETKEEPKQETKEKDRSKTASVAEAVVEVGTKVSKRLHGQMQEK